MAPPAPTIPTLKQNFLTTQTRLLSQPLQPSRTWRRANDSAEDATRVPERAVDDALFRLNHTLQQHARRVYAPQATRHVAEQIDRLYLSVGERGADGGGDDAEGEGGEEGWRNVGADHADAGIIASLPPAWESEREVEAYPLEAKRYAELVARLQDLSARKQQAEARVRRLRRMKGLLAPFEMDGEKAGADGATNGVQENLVTRDGEVEKELERMRMLLVRVGDKVSRLKGRVGEDEEDEDLFGDGDAMIIDDVEVEERRKVEGLLDGLV
ncbi:Kinetochore protein fta4 [Cytospora mali]|uniref:Kinetochore protein fta4 n=1 Tax=Cytospora mali TaxID=578113 RepID=A0A194VBK6_CYTMA|nr:Kinetochore protein fta4 [Valsa mali var. pyri (nom. inval.)]